MSVTNYTLDKCKYIHSKLKNVLYLVSADHVKDVHIDNGEAYISGLTELPLRINGFNIQYSEETSLDERYKFDKKITLSMKGYVNYKVFGERYYAIIEDNDGIYYMINVDFPSKITHTFNLSNNTNQTDFTFHSLSNFPTIKLNADFAAWNLPCLGYNVYGIRKLNLINKDYARLDTINKTVITTDNWSNIEFLGKSCSFQEVYDGENVTDTITFDIPLNHKIGWSWNLLEFLDNLYSAIIIPNGDDNVFYSGFNFGLQPSYTIQTSSNNGESDIITVTLVEMSNYGATAAVDYDDDDWDTTHWIYTKYVDDIVCYECVGYARARYLVQEEVDAFGNPTGNYKVKDGYQSEYQMLNITGTFENDEQFTESSCAGDSCNLNTNIPNVISYSSATCNTYSISASCDWNISDLAPYLNANPSTGSANTQYSVSICNTSDVMGQESTFNINYGNSVKVVNVVLSNSSFINPVTVYINCLGQNVTFTYNTNCPITVISNPSNLTYQITNSNLIVTAPRNNEESAVTYTMTVQNCNYETQVLTIIQDKTYVKWEPSGYICVSGNSYTKEIKYTGSTNYNYVATDVYRQGSLITSGDTRCQTTKKWEFVNHYYCVDGNKFKCIEEFESYDGINWTPTMNTRLGEMVESASSFCNSGVTYEWRLNQNKYECEGEEEPIDYSTQYLTLVAIDSTAFAYTKVSGGTILYSLDSGSTWIEDYYIYNNNTHVVHTPVIQSGNKVMFKGVSGNDNNVRPITSSGGNNYSARFNVEGNVMSMVYGDNFSGQTNLSGMCFSHMFTNCSGLTDAGNLILPALNLSERRQNNDVYGCYAMMFNACSSLVAAPQLPATGLTRACYYQMFGSCTSLTTPPELPATTLAAYCYANMFYKCTSLATAPELPATTLAIECYNYMFDSCTSLTTAPVLSATTLVDNCYTGMFANCSNLSYVKCLATDISATDCTKLWLINVSQSGLFIKNSSMNGWTNGYNGIPVGWSVQNAT